MKKIVLLFIAIIALFSHKVYAQAGEYIIALDNGKVLNADAGSVNNDNCKIQIWDYVPNSPNQKWLVRNNCNGAYSIKCVASAGNKVLTADSGGSVELYRSDCDKSQTWFLSPIGGVTAKGQGYIIVKTGINDLNVLTINPSARNINGTPATVTTTRKPYPSNLIWYLRAAEQTRLKVTFKGISLSNIHNDDCKKVWGTLRAELWEMNGDGSNARQIANPFAGDALMMNWTGRTKRNIANYGALTNYMTVDNVNSSVVFSVDPSFLSDRGGMTPDNQLRQRTIVLKIFTRIYAAHKSCDLCTDYTENAGVRGEQQQTLYINGAWQSKLKRSFPAKDGPMMAGPFRSAAITDHFYRLHFDIEKLD